MGLGYSAKDRVGKSESIEKQTGHIAGLGICGQ